MADPNEIAALQASFRGAIGTAAALQELQEKVERIEPAAEIGANDLEDLARVTAAHAIAAAALRGLVVTMMARRGAPAPE
jgi:thiamine biosynthesis protein ThiC